MSKKKWIVGEPSGPSGPFYSVITSEGFVVALQVPDKEVAERIARLPRLEKLESLLRCIGKKHKDSIASRLIRETLGDD